MLMARYLSEQERKMYEDDLAAAEPYSDEEMSIIDGDRDADRVKATFAKIILRMADEDAGKMFRDEYE